MIEVIGVSIDSEAVEIAADVVVGGTRFTAQLGGTYTSPARDVLRRIQPSMT